MLRLRKEDLGAAALRYATALLMGAGMSLCALGALLPAQAAWPAVFLCALFTLGFEMLFSIQLKRKWLLPVGLIAALGAWGALGGGPVYTAIQLGKAAFLTLRGIPDAALPYADTARWTVCLLLSLLAAGLSWDDTLPLSVFCVALVVGLCFVFGVNEQMLLFALPAAAGLLMMLARISGRRAAALATAAGLTLLAFFLMPGKAQPVPALENAARQVRQFLEDYLFFNEFRTSFSLASEGYQPLEDQLGGPALPENRSVMEVSTDRVLLLRGRTYNEYSGLNWYDTLSSRRYLYASPRFAGLREDLFDLKRPLAGAENVALRTVRVHLLSNATTTLFAPLRTRTLQTESERMVVYHNLAGELFLTRDFVAGDAYTVTYLPFAPGTAETEAAVTASADQEDPYYAEVAEQYLSLPTHIQQEIYDLAVQATAGAQTPYAKALAIQEYLRANYRYTLNAQTPPDSVDFVAWFLLGAKEGYCTYFATAMTVLCRIAGLPARYVTGYLAVPDENGVALITGEQAHAWTEVYLSGFGWLDFDATPRSDNERGGDSDSDEQTPPQPSPEPEGEPSPTPSAAPTPSPSPAPEDAPSEEPSEQPSDQPSDQPSSAPQTPTPAPDAPFSPDEEPEQPPFPWWLLLAALLLIGLIIWRYLFTLPERRAARHPEDAARIYFDEISALLSLRGLKRLPQETLRDFARRADERLAETGEPLLSPLTEAYAAQIYGRHAAAAEPLESAYRALRQGASRLGRVWLALARMTRIKIRSR